MKKDNFSQMIQQNKDLILKVLEKLSNDLYSHPLKSCCYLKDSAENKIEQLCYSLKYDDTDQELFSFEIKMSLKKIADTANMSIRSVQSAIKNLEDQGLIRIVEGKIFF